MNPKMRTILFLIFGTGLFHPLQASAQTILGRWCDQMIPGKNTMNRMIAIEIDSDGSTVAKSEFFDGSKLTQILSEMGNGIFSIIDSPSGDKYRLVSSSGELQLLDNDGIIRVARRLENSPQPNDCIR